MPATKFSSSREAAQAALATLEPYARDVRHLVASWLDADLYQRVGHQMERLRHDFAALPELSAPWVELLISHAELVHCLWRSAHLPADEGAKARGAQLAAHLERVDATLRRCMAIAMDGRPH